MHHEPSRPLRRTRSSGLGKPLWPWKRWKVASAGALLLAPAVFAAYPIRPPAGNLGPELSAPFRDLMERKVPPPDSSSRDYRILIVPGFFADPMSRVFGYFADEISALRDAGMKEGADYEVLGPESGFSGEASVEGNARAIVKAIRASDRPVLLVTHSKGSADALAALLDQPDIQGRVRGWFSIQGAVWGSPVADEVSKSWDHLVLDQALRWYGGSPRALTDLRRPTRYSYMTSHREGIAALVRKVPTVSLASWKLSSRMSWNLRQIDLFYYPDYPLNISDGLVEIDDALIPGTPYILLKGVDHDDTTISSAFQGFDRRAFIGAILALFPGL